MPNFENSSSHSEMKSHFIYNNKKNKFMISWEERRKLYNNLPVGTSTDQLLTIFPEDIHYDLIKAIIFSQPYFVVKSINNQNINDGDRLDVVKKFISDMMYLSLYYTYMNPTYQIDTVISTFSYIYRPIIQLVKSLYPRASIIKFFSLLKFIKYIDIVNIYPKYPKDYKKIQSLIRLLDLDQSNNNNDLYRLPVKQLTEGYSFKINRNKSRGIDLNEFYSLFENIEFSLIQTSLLNLDSYETLTSTLNMERLDIFIGNEFQDPNTGNLIIFDGQKFKIKNKSGDFQLFKTPNLTLILNNPNTFIYSTHPEIISIESDYDIPINQFDIAKWSIDHDRYEIPNLPYELQEPQLRELFEQCQRERLHPHLEN